MSETRFEVALTGELVEPIQTKLLCFIGGLSSVDQQDMRKSSTKGRIKLVNGLKEAGLLENQAAGLISKIVQSKDADLNSLLSVCRKFKWGAETSPKRSRTPPECCKTREAAAVQHARALEEVVERVHKRQRPGPEDAARSVPDPGPGPAEEKECPVCMESDKTIALDPCGHMLCGNCVKYVRKCPICRRDIRSVLRVFI